MGGGRGVTRPGTFTGFLSPSIGPVPCSSPTRPPASLGHNLHCKPPGSRRTDPHRKPLPYHKAWILRGFLNQEKALK